MAEEDFDEIFAEGKSKLDSMLATAQSKLDSQRQQQTEKEFIKKESEAPDTISAYESARSVLKTLNPEVGNTEQQTLRPTPLETSELTEDRYNTNRNRPTRDRDAITVDPRLAEAKRLREEAFLAMDQGSRGGQNTQESEELYRKAAEQEAQVRQDRYNDRLNPRNLNEITALNEVTGEPVAPRNMQELTSNEEEITDTTQPAPTTDDTENEQPLSTAPINENQTGNQQYDNFREARLKRSIDNLGLGDTNEARALAMRLYAAGISSLKFGSFIRQNNKERLALGKAAHSDLDSYMGDFLLTQAEQEAGVKGKGYGIRRNRLPQGQFDPQTGERYIPTLTKGGKELRALAQLRNLVETGVIDYSQLDQLLFTRGTVYSTFDARDADQARGGAQSAIPLSLNAYTRLLKEKEVESKNIAREADKAKDLIALQVAESQLALLNQSKVPNQTRLARLEAPDEAGQIPAVGIRLFLSLQKQLEDTLTTDMQDKVEKRMAATLEKYGITFDDVKFYTIMNTKTNR